MIYDIGDVVKYVGKHNIPKLPVLYTIVDVMMSSKSYIRYRIKSNIKLDGFYAAFEVDPGDIQLASPSEKSLF